MSSPTDNIDKPLLTRRRFLLTGTGAIAIVSAPVPLHATPERMQAAIQEQFGDREITTGRVSISIPPIAENGYSVPIDISVDSQMTERDHVASITVFSERNPLPTIVRFNLTPHSGLAKVSTRIRLGGTQTLTVIAELSDGTLWAGTAETVVTLAACVIM